MDWRPGYDGEYGHFQIFAPGELDEVEGQLSLTLEPAAAAADPASHEAASAPAPSPDAPAPSPDVPASSSDVPATKSPLLSGLNEDQRQALLALAPVTAVIAGPGTGKTRTLVAKILYLLRERGVKAGEITAVTFTRKAAAELKSRLAQGLSGTRISGRIQTGTFHSPLLWPVKKLRQKI